MTAAKGMSNKGGKISPFKKQGKGMQSTVTPKPGSNKSQLDNIKQLAGVKGSPKKAPTVTVKPSGRNKAQLDNLRKWGSSKGGQGDQPYSGK